MRISGEPGAAAMAATRSGFRVSPRRLTRCRAPSSRSWRGRSRSRWYSIRRRSASVGRTSASGREASASISELRFGYRVGSSPWAAARSCKTWSGNVEKASRGEEGVRQPPGESIFPTAINVAGARSCIRRPIPPQDFDRPLDLSELTRIAACVRMEAAGPVAVRALDLDPWRPATTEPGRMHADVLESEDAESGFDPFRLKIELPQVGENPAGFVSAFDTVSFVVPRDHGPRAVVASACETEEPLRHVPPTADSLMAFRVSEAKVMRVRRLGVDCVVPGRALRVQRPGETIVRLPPRKDGPPGGTDAAALQPPEAYRRGGSLEQRLPVRPRGDGEDPHGEALLLGLQEVRVGIGPRGRLGPRELPPADGGRRRPAR